MKQIDIVFHLAALIAIPHSCRALYLARREVLLARRAWNRDRTAGYIMPPVRSIDVDTPWDVRLARLAATDSLDDV